MLKDQSNNMCCRDRSDVQMGLIMYNSGNEMY